MGLGKRKSKNSSESKKYECVEDVLDEMPEIRDEIKKDQRKRHAKSRRYLKKELKQLFPDEEKEAMEQTLETIQKVKRYLPESQTNVLEQTIKEIQRLLNKDENEDGTDSDEEITDDFNKENKDLNEQSRDYVSVSYDIIPQLDEEAGICRDVIRGEIHHYFSKEENIEDLDEQLKEYVAYKVIPPLIEDAKEAYNKKEYRKADKIITEIEKYAKETDAVISRDLIMLKKEVLGNLPVEYMIEKFRNHKQQIGELAEDMITQGSEAARIAYDWGYYDHVVYAITYMKEVAKLTNKSLPKDIKKIYRTAKRMGSENFEDPWKLDYPDLFIG
jgi:hypothetical protein